MQMLFLRTGGGLLVGSDLVQTQSDIENVHKVHFLKKATEKPFILHKLFFWALQAFSLLPLTG